MRWFAPGEWRGEIVCSMIIYKTRSFTRLGHFHLLCWHYIFSFALRFFFHSLPLTLYHYIYSILAFIFRQREWLSVTSISLKSLLNDCFLSLSSSFIPQEYSVFWPKNISQKKFIFFLLLFLPTTLSFLSSSSSSSWVWVSCRQNFSLKTALLITLLIILACEDEEEAFTCLFLVFVCSLFIVFHYHLF